MQPDFHSVLSWFRAAQRVGKVLPLPTFALGILGSYGTGDEDLPTLQLLKDGDK